MTGDDLIDRFIATLLRAHGGTRRRWRTVIGAVRIYDPATHPHCNWSIAPSGSGAEVAAVETAADTLRETCPILDR